MTVVAQYKIAPSNLSIGAILYDWNFNQWAILDRCDGMVKLHLLSDDERVIAQ